LTATHRQHRRDRVRLIPIDPRHERRHRQRGHHVRVLRLERSQLAIPRRDHQYRREGAIVLDEDGEGHKADLASRAAQERRYARHFDAVPEAEVAAVIKKAALAAPLGRRPRPDLLEPPWHWGRSSERIDDERSADLSAAVRADTDDAHTTLAALAVADQPDDAPSRPQRDARFGFHRLAEGVFEHGPSRADRDERLVLGPHLSRQQLVLPVLGGAELDRRRQHIRRLLRQHLPTKRQEVVRLPKVRDPGTFPLEEQLVSGAVTGSRVALEHEHAAPAAREGKGGGETGQAGTDHHHVSSIPTHAADHQRPEQRVQASGSAASRPGLSRGQQTIDGTRIRPPA
jgi:hypothetical protein